MYAFSEYSYISEICDSPKRAKQSIAPRFATPLQDSRLASILSEVCLAWIKAYSILTDLVLAISKVQISGTLSTSGISDSFDNSESKVSSSSFSSALFADVSTISCFLCDSSSGLSYPTTSLRSQSLNPKRVTLKLIIIVLPKISGVQLGLAILVVINILNSGLYSIF